MDLRKLSNRNARRQIRILFRNLVFSIESLALEMAAGVRSSYNCPQPVSFSCFPYTSCGIIRFVPSVTIGAVRDRVDEQFVALIA